MNLIEKLFSSDYAYIVSLISVASLVVTYLSSLRAKNYDMDKKRLETVISPLFELSEQYMGKTEHGLTNEQVAPLKHVIAASKPLSGGILREFAEYDLIPFSVGDKRRMKRFNSFLAYVNREYDNLCKRIGIPVRSWRYRLSQYRPRFSYWAITGLVLLSTLYAILYLVLFLFGISLLFVAMQRLGIDILSIEAVPSTLTFVLMCIAIFSLSNKTVKK